MRLHKALGKKEIVGRHHRVRAHALLACAFAHRRQPRSGRQQAGTYAVRKPLGELFGQAAG